MSLLESNLSKSDAHAKCTYWAGKIVKFNGQNVAGVSVEKQSSGWGVKLDLYADRSSKEFVAFWNRFKNG